MVEELIIGIKSALEWGENPLYPLILTDNLSSSVIWIFGLTQTVSILDSTMSDV